VIAIRNSKCTLPIEVFHEHENIDLCEHKFGQQFNVRFEKTLYKLAPYSSRFTHKIAAVLSSEFTELLILDVDNIPLFDVSFLFDEAQKKDVSAIFWPDIRTLSFKHGYPDKLKYGVNKEILSFEQESGQVVILKNEKNDTGTNLWLANPLQKYAR